MTNKIKCSKGYGVITQSVMSSKDISIEAKALYCYYMAHVGTILFLVLRKHATTYK